VSRSYASSVSSALVLERARGRSCKAMPDIRSPEYVAGLCWWVDYSALLAEVGLLDQIRKVVRLEHMPSERPALFRPLQVPLWYKTKGSNGSLLVFFKRHDS
jgi:hypothetical protein